jgi:uncharacterized protein (TIGR02444 family)
MSQDIDDAAARLWAFAVAIYEDEAVKSHCLSIQARYGLSISILLGCVWAGANGYGRLGATHLEMAIRRGVEWHREIIEPMRSLRWRLRQNPPPGLKARTESLRHRLLDEELEAERIEQRLFLEDFPADTPVADEGEHWRDAAANAACYTRKSCPQPEQPALKSLGAILHSVFPAIAAEDLEHEAEVFWRGR